MGVLIVFGYGPGISQSTAERFGREGYSLALVGRSADRLADGVAHLRPGASRRPRMCLMPANHRRFDRPSKQFETISGAYPLFSGPPFEAEASRMCC